MSYRHRLVLLIAVTITPYVFENRAVAESFSTQSLGQTPVSYVEHRLSINETSDASWSEINGSTGFPEARVFQTVEDQNVDLHALIEGSGEDDVQSRAEDVNDDRVVVGYSANTVQSVRHAGMWIYDSGTFSYEFLDLHEPTEAAILDESDDPTPHAWTGAYGVSEVFSDHVLVVGQRRVSLSQRSVPVVWLVNLATQTVTVSDLPIGGADYGLGYDVLLDTDDVTSSGSVDSIRVYATGGTGMSTGGDAPGATAYLYAHLWSERIDVDTSGPSPVVTLPISWSDERIAELGAPSFATSSGTRLAKVDLDETTPTPFVVGSAVRENRESAAFICELGAGASVSCNSDLSDGPTLENSLQSLGFSVANMSGAASGFPTVVGASNALFSFITPAAPSTEFLRGYYAYGPAFGSESTAEDFYACVADADDGNSGSPLRTVYDLNEAGDMIGRANGEAILLQRIPKSPQAEIYLRQSADAPQDYWWVEYEDLSSASPSTSPNGGYVFSDAIGCAAFASCAGTTASLSDNNADDAILGIWDGTYEHTEGDGVYVPYSEQVFGTPPTGTYPATDVTQLKFQASVSYGSAVCDWSEVSDFDSTADEPDTTDVVLNPQYDPFGGIWGDCDSNPANGFEKELSSDASNCGACGNVCPSGAACSGGACTTLIISEFLYDADNSLPDSRNEWVEIYVTPGSLDVSGYIQTDNFGAGDFPAGSVLSGDAYYVLAACAEEFETNNGVTADFEWAPTANGCAFDDPDVPNMQNVRPSVTAIAYANGGDEVAFFDASSNLIDGVSYASNNTYLPDLSDIDDGNSWSLSNLDGSDVESNWIEDTAPTPGAAHN